MTTFKTTDFKVGDIVIYRSWAGAKLCYVLELTPSRYASSMPELFNYQIVSSPENTTHNGKAEHSWTMSKDDLVKNVVAKF